MTADDVPRPHRPALFADLTEMIDAAGGTAPASRAEIAAATAAVVVRAGRTPGEHNDGGQRFVGLADEVGLETLAALWRDAEPVSLPGALWALYLLRQWCRTNPIEVTRLWRAGEPLAPADAAVAGVSDYADVAAIQRLPDAVLAGVYTGDLAVALERAAAFFRVVAAGRRYLLEDDSDPQLRRSTADDMRGSTADDMRGSTADDMRGSTADDMRGSTADDMRGSTADEMALAEGNERAAAALSASARRWRAGTLR